MSRNGLGHATFLKWFDEKDSSALESRLRDAYEVNGQTAWSLLTKAGALPNSSRFKIAGRRGPPHANDTGRSLTDVLDTIDDRTEGYIMQRGAALLPQLQSM